LEEAHKLRMREKGQVEKEFLALEEKLRELKGTNRDLSEELRDAKVQSKEGEEKAETLSQQFNEMKKEAEEKKDGLIRDMERMALSRNNSRIMRLNKGEKVKKELEEMRGKYIQNSHHLKEELESALKNIDVLSGQLDMTAQSDHTARKLNEQMNEELRKRDYERKEMIKQDEHLAMEAEQLKMAHMQLLDACKRLGENQGHLNGELEEKEKENRLLRRESERWRMSCHDLKKLLNEQKIAVEEKKIAVEEKKQMDGENAGKVV